MSILGFLETVDGRQADDIEDLRQRHLRLSETAASRDQLRALAAENRELAIAVRVLMQTLHAAGILDIERLQHTIAEEIHARPRVPDIDVDCIRCNASGHARDMVKAGADWFCRTCARNP